MALYNSFTIIRVTPKKVTVVTIWTVHIFKRNRTIIILHYKTEKYPLPTFW